MSRSFSVNLCIGVLALLPASPAAAEAVVGKEQYRALLKSEAQARGIPFELADAVMRVESGYDASAVGGDGEVGLMQVLPSTAVLMDTTVTSTKLAEPATNIALGTRYLAEAWGLARGDICTTVMKYRAGHGETRFSVRSVNYCVAVRSHMAGLGYKLTGIVPKAEFGSDDSGPARGFRGRMRIRFGGSSACFARVIQPGKNFGKCIRKARFKAKKLVN